MISRLEIVPRTSSAANYEAVVNGDVFRAEDGAYGSATSRPGQTVITGSISPAEGSHKFLVRHSGALAVQLRGPVTKQVEEDAEGFSPTVSRQPAGGAPGKGSTQAPQEKLLAKAPAFGIPGRDAVPNERVKRGMPFSDNLLGGKTAVRNSRVGGILQWQANQNPGAELPVKAVISANNPDRPIEAIEKVAGGRGAGGGASFSMSGLSARGLGASGGSQGGQTVVTFQITGQQAEKLERIEGATFFLEGTSGTAVGNVGVPVSGGMMQNGSTGAGPNGGAPNGSGASTSGSGSNGGGTPPASKDRIISGIPDALLGAGLFAVGAMTLAYTSRSAQGDGN
jgi:hypothetical protein